MRKILANIPVKCSLRNPNPDELRQGLYMERLSPTASKALEDYVTAIIDAWDETRKATAYAYLHAQGMTIAKARALRVKAGLSS